MTDEEPNAGIVIVDEAFFQLVSRLTNVRRIADGFQFTEGPVWMDDGGYLLFSDIPADAIYRWTEHEGHVVWRQPSGHANGNTVDGAGRLVTCEHGSRSVTRTDSDGTITTLASTYNDKKLNSPNDVVVKSDGTIWFTDPPYGIEPEMIEQPANYVFRLDDSGGEPVAVVSDMSRPNGLCFSPDEQYLYVADSDKSAHHIRRFHVRSDNTLEGGEVFATVEPGPPDGMRMDSRGDLWTSAGDGVQAFSPAGTLLGKITTPKPASNCAFGGPDHRRLFITAQDSIWTVTLGVAGAAR